MVENAVFRNNNVFLKVLIGWYLFFWLVMAIAPLSRFDWLVQNTTPFVFACALISSYRRFQFSPLSYLLITLFMTLHVIGAHYTYAQVPFGDWLKDAFALSRNCFDRVVHFAFGLLMTYPLREIFLRVFKGNRVLSNVLSLSGALAFSAIWEILESLLAQGVSPESGPAYLGAQGDQWDAQNDMAAALYGSLLCVGLTMAWERLFEKEALLAGEDSPLEPSQLPT
jgi:putative membrane protein